MNQDVFNGKIKEISGELKKKWGQLTEDEIGKTKGNLESLAGLVQQKYGVAKEQAAKDVTEFMQRFEKKDDDVTRQASDRVNEKIDNMKDRLS